MYLPYYIENQKNSFSSTILIFSGLLLLLHPIADQFDFQQMYWLNTGEGTNFSFWNLISPFIHLDFGHALINAISLFIFGTYIHKQVGVKALLWVVLPSILFVPVLSSLTNVNSIGLSGTVCALMGFTLAAAPSAQAKSALVLLAKNGTFKVSVVWLIAYQIYSDLAGLAGVALGHATSVDHIAHLAGLAYGYGLAKLAQKNPTQIALARPAIGIWPIIRSFFITAEQNKAHPVTLVCGVAVVVVGVISGVAGHFALPTLHPDPEVVDRAKLWIYGIPSLVVLAGMLAIIGHKTYARAYLFAFFVGSALNVYWIQKPTAGLFLVTLAILLTQQSSFTSFRTSAQPALQAE